MTWKAFCVTGSLWGESTSDGWISLTVSFELFFDVSLKKLLNNWVASDLEHNVLQSLIIKSFDSAKISRLYFSLKFVVLYTVKVRKIDLFHQDDRARYDLDKERENRERELRDLREQEQRERDREEDPYRRLPERREPDPRDYPHGNRWDWKNIVKSIA